MAYLNERLRGLDSDACPDYDSAMSRSNSNVTSTSGALSRSVHWPSSEESSTSPRQRNLPSHKTEGYLYTYNLLAGATPLQFLISVEPSSGKPSPGKYTFRLSSKINGVGRNLCEPHVLRLSVDPRQLEFAVFIFPGKPGIPVGALYSLRVWLRVNGVDHRIFADDQLWVGKDLDFNSIGDASFVRLKSVDSKTQIYHGFVGRVLVTFICRWHRVSENLYRYSLDYEANGVGGNLFEDIKLRIDGDPRTVTFLIYSIPTESKPAKSVHKLRVWIKSLINLSANDPSTAFALPFHDSYIYQRIWKSDNFRIGARLDFESMGNWAIMGFSAGAPQTIIAAKAPPAIGAHHIPDEKTQRGYH